MKIGHDWGSIMDLSLLRCCSDDLKVNRRFIYAYKLLDRNAYHMFDEMVEPDPDVFLLNHWAESRNTSTQLILGLLRPHCDWFSWKSTLIFYWIGVMILMLEIVSWFLIFYMNRIQCSIVAICSDFSLYFIFPYPYHSDVSSLHMRCGQWSSESLPLEIEAHWPCLTRRQSLTMDSLSFPLHLVVFISCVSPFLSAIHIFVIALFQGPASTKSRLYSSNRRNSCSFCIRIAFSLKGLSMGILM